jgi:hypothetical protein
MLDAVRLQSDPCQMRTIVVCGGPVFFAIARLLQWVLFSSIDSSVHLSFGNQSRCGQPPFVQQAFQPIHPKAFPRCNPWLRDLRHYGFLDYAFAKALGLKTF